MPQNQIQIASQTVFLMASRTGGPLIPLLALKDDLNLAKPNLKFIIVGIKGGVEEKLATLENLPLIYLPEVKNRRAEVRFKGLFGQVMQKLENFALVVWTMCGLGFSTVLSIYFALKYQPKLVLSTSNFLSVPMIWGIAFSNLFKPKATKTKIAIHLLDPQNQTINLTKPFADLLTTGFESMTQALDAKAITVSSPVRHQLFQKYNPQQAKQKLVEAGLIDINSSHKPLFLIFGGGSGAQFINHWVDQNAVELTKVCTVIHLSGFLRASKEKIFLPDLYQNAGLTDLMPAALVAADLVLARAGMSSISELLFLEKPAFLVPMPDSHQEQNAALVQNYFQILNQNQSHGWLAQILKQIETNFEFAKSVQWDKYQDKNNQEYLNLLLKLLK